MKKALHILLALIFVSMGLTSCSRYKDKKVNLYTGMQPIKTRLEVLDFSPDFVELRIRVNKTEKWGEKLYHIITDAQKNFISEGWYLSQNRAYTIKMKVKEGFFFEPGKEYALCIGLQNPEGIIRYSVDYRCEIYQKFTMQIQPSVRLRPAPPPPAPTPATQELPTVRAIGDIKPPKLIKQVAPIYPETARCVFRSKVPPHSGGKYPPIPFESPT